MTDMGWRQELCREFGHPVPGSAIPLAALRERASPEIDHIVPEGPEAPAVGRHRVIREVSANDLSQPLTLERDWFVHAPPQLFFDCSQPCPHPVAARLPFELESAPARPAADVSEPKEVERFRLAQAAAFSIFGRKATEFDSRVFSGCSDSANFSSRCRMSAMNRFASRSCWKPMTISSA
jgi:hypothetical protein